MPAPVIRTTDPSHIVATKDAVIKEIITRSGTPMVKPGDVVKKRRYIGFWNYRSNG